MKKRYIWLVIIIILTILTNEILKGNYNIDFNKILILNMGAYRNIGIRGFTSWFINYSMILFFFFGFFKRDLLSYGYIEIVKSKSKLMWINKKIRVGIFFISLYVIVTQIINVCLNYFNVESLNFYNYILGICLYLLFLTFMMQLQGALEIKFSEEYSSLFCMSYVVISTILGGIIYEFRFFEKMLYFLLPNSCMIYRNNLYDAIEFGIVPEISFVILIIANIIMYFILRISCMRGEVI